MTGCHNCRHWLRGHEGPGRQSASPTGDCTHPALMDGQEPDRTRWDDWCERHEQARKAP